MKSNVQLLTPVLREGPIKHPTQFSADWEKSNGSTQGTVVHEGLLEMGKNQLLNWFVRHENLFFTHYNGFIKKIYAAPQIVNSAHLI